MKRTTQIIFIGGISVLLSILLFSVPEVRAQVGSDCRPATRGITTFSCDGYASDFVCGTAPAFRCLSTPPPAIEGSEAYNCASSSCAIVCTGGTIACSGSETATAGAPGAACRARTNCSLAGRTTTNPCAGTCSTDCAADFTDPTPSTTDDPCVPERPPVTLAPFGSDTDNTGSPSIWVNKVPRPTETEVLNPLVQLQENGSDRLRVDSSGNLRIIGRSATEGGDLYLNSGKAIRMDNAGATTLHFGNYGGGAFGVNILGNLTLGTGFTLLAGSPAGSLMTAGNIYTNAIYSRLATASADAIWIGDTNDTVQVPGNLSVGTELTVNGTIQGNFVDSNGANCANGQLLRRAATAWACADAPTGATYTAGRNIEGAALVANIIAVRPDPTFEQLAIGGSAVDLGASVGGDSLFSAVIPYANLAPFTIDSSGALRDEGDYLLKLQTTAAAGTAVDRLRVDRDGNVLLGAPAIGGAGSSTLLSTGGNLILDNDSYIFVNQNGAESRLSVRNLFPGEVRLEVGGPLRVFGRAGFGSIEMSPDWWVGMPSLYVGVVNDAGRVGTRIGPGPGQRAGDFSTDGSGAFGGYAPDPAWRVTTPSMYVGDATPAGSTFIGAGAGQRAGDLLTGRNLAVGGELSVIGGAQIVRGDLLLGPPDSRRDTSDARRNNYLEIRNMDNDPGTDSPSEQFAIRVEDEDENEWFSVRRTGYAGGAPAPVQVRTSGNISAGSISATGALGGVGLTISGSGTLNRLTVGTSATDLGTSAGGDNLVYLAVPAANVNSTDYLLRIETTGTGTGSVPARDNLTLTAGGILTAPGIVSTFSTTVGSDLNVNGNTRLGNASTDATTINGTLDVGGAITSGSSNVQITTSAGGLKLAEIANEDFDTHTTASGATARLANEGYLVIGIRGNQGTCTNACDKHGLLCDGAYRIGNTAPLISTGDRGCGIDDTNDKLCWCRG